MSDAEEDDLFDESDSTEKERGAPDTTPTESGSPEDVSADVGPVLQPGIFQGLATTIPAGGTTLLAIAKLADGSLLVSIQPARAKDEDAATALPLQIKGSSAEIDRDMLEALSHYVPARQYVITSAEETARATTVAAAARAAEAKKKTSSSTARPASAKAADKKPDLIPLTIDCSPAQAKLTVADAAGKQISATPGTPLQLASGTYTVSASAAQFESLTETVDLLAARTVTLKLVESAPSFAF